MAQQDVELIRRMSAAFNEGDWETWRQLIDPAIVYIDGPNRLDTPAVIRGRDAVERVLLDFGSAFERWGVELEQAIDCAGQVVTAVRWWGVGAGSGVETEIHECVVWRVAEGVIVHGQVYVSLDAGLEAVSGQL